MNSRSYEEAKHRAISTLRANVQAAMKTAYDLGFRQGRKLGRQEALLGAKDKLRAVAKRKVLAQKDSNE